MLETFRWFMPSDPPDEGCWPWAGGSFHSFGYGLVGFDGKLVGAHVMSYQLFKGEIPDGEQIRHTCDNPPCVHPDHLLTGTTLDNMRDKVKRGRQPRGEQAPRAKLTPEQVMEVRELYAGGATQTQLASRYNISQASISAIILRKSWKHLPASVS